MPNDARNKLRSMGGIMASSPELMQAAQGYQAGGPVMTGPQLPQPDSVTVPGVGAPVVGLGRVQPMQPPRPVAGGIPALALETPVQRYAAGVDINPYAPPPSSYLMGAGDEPDVTVDDLVESSVSGGSANRRLNRSSPAEEPSAAELAEVSIGSKRRSSSVTPPQEVPPADLAAEAERLRERAQSLTGRGSFNARKRLEQEAAELDAQAARAFGTTQAPPRPVYDNPVFMENLLPPGAEEPSRAEKIKKRAEELSKDAETTAPQPDTGGGDTSAGTGTGDGTDGPGPRTPPPEPTKKDLRSRYKEILGLYKDVLGEEDDDKALGFIMDLAVGLLAGQSPSFATNLATGTAGALQGMSEREQARRERERGLRTSALETAIGEMDAEREAAARAAESRLEFERQKILKGMESDGGSGSGFRNARNVAEQALLEEKKIKEDIEINGVPEKFKNNRQAYITNERNKQMLEYVDTLGIQGTIEDPRMRASLGQQYMYKDVDPEDPSAGRFPVVRSPRELSFILPGQSYLKLDPQTGKYTRQTKPADE